MILADVAGTSADMERSSKLIKHLQINCQEKNVAMAKLQEVHDNRLQRMGTLQEYLRFVNTISCKLRDSILIWWCRYTDKIAPTWSVLDHDYFSEVLDELKNLDKDRWRELSCGYKDVPHNPQPLRHEDRWNYHSSQLMKNENYNVYHAVLPESNLSVWLSWHHLNTFSRNICASVLRFGRTCSITKLCVVNWRGNWAAYRNS